MKAIIISLCLIGCFGTWEIPSIGTTTYLYESPVNDLKHNQAVVDREDSALWWPYGAGHAICDHAMSEAGDGVWDVSQIHIGDIATLTQDKTNVYVCVGTALCRTRKKDYAFKGKPYKPMKKGDVVCVSCAETDGWVYAAYFEPIS